MRSTTFALILVLLLSVGCASYNEPPPNATGVSEVRTGEWRVHAVDGQSVGFFFPSEIRVLPGTHTFKLKPSLAQDKVRGTINPSLDVEENSIYEVETAPGWSSVTFRKAGPYR